MFFDFDLFVIGVGLGGVCVVCFVVGFGVCVVVVESCYLGGICVNVGCVLKKLLVYGVYFSEDFEQVWVYGWSVGEVQFDWVILIGNKNCEIQWFNGIYCNLLVNSGVILFEGYVCLFDVYNVEVDGQCFSVKYIFVVIGGWLQVLDIFGKEYVIIFNEVFFFECLLCCVLVVGGGYIVVEFVLIFNGFGVEIILFYCCDLFLCGFDCSVCEYLCDELGKKGLDLQFNSDIVCIDKQVDGSLVVIFKDGWVLEVDCVFYVIGWWLMLDDFGLENIGVKLIDKGFIVVDEYYQISELLIFVLGDVIGCVQLIFVVLVEGMVVVWWLFKLEEYCLVDYKLIFIVVFSLFNIGIVGLIEEEVLSVGYKVKIFESCFWLMKLIFIDDQEKILMKLVVDVYDDRVLGCYMVGVEVGEIFQGIVVVMKVGVIKQVFDEIIGIYLIVVEEFVILCMLMC